MPSCKLWIGTVHLRPLTPRDWSAFEDGGHSSGAYTNVVTWACDAGKFRQKVETLAAQHRLYVVDTEGEEPLEQRAELSDELEEIAQRAQLNREAIIFGRFFTYPHEDA